MHQLTRPLFPKHQLARTIRPTHQLPQPLPNTSVTQPLRRIENLRSTLTEPIGPETPGGCQHPTPRTAILSDPSGRQHQMPVKRLPQPAVPVGIVFIRVMLVVPLPPVLPYGRSSCWEKGGQ